LKEKKKARHMHKTVCFNYTAEILYIDLGQ